MRRRAEPDYLGLKSAFRRLLQESGGLKAAAEVTRIGPTSLSECASRDHADRYPPADVILDLETHVGEAIVSRQLVHLVADRADMETHASPGNDVAAVLHMATRGQVALGELARCAVEAAEDGVLSDSELAQLIQRAETRMHVAQSDYDALMKLRETRRGQPHRRAAAKSGRSPR
ncbi:hypothetical protein [Roseospira marina]|uniref:hypothetical protein n=1 Tax=Roseospira marina TaxID=140057 RepID=UPI001478D2FB|nr:hypothetical protein [Roseospira marina]MBB4316122.1 hypothetical protein [Roseospira marina]MBB5089320.1 hypothetical protein [Roseospira marina]